MSKKILGVGVVLALVAAVFVGVASTVSAQSMSLCQTVDALVAAGVIAPDKVAAAKAAAGCGSTTSSACYSFTKDLTVGSTGADVSALQAKLSVSPATGYFGAITKAAVQAYQTSKGISATGYVGPLTRAALNACVVVVPSNPDSNSSSNDLEGTDGTIATIEQLSSYSNEEIGAGQEGVKIAGFEVTASKDGDIQLKSVKLTFSSTGNDSSDSDRLSDYVDSVSIIAGSDVVATADVSDFTKDSTGVYSKTMTLDNLVLNADDDVKMYVAVDAVSNLDSGDIDSDSWTVGIVNIRYVDGGDVTTTEVTAIPSDIDYDTAGDGVAMDFVSFSSAADTELKVTVDSSTPDADIVLVDDNSETDGVVLLKGKIQIKGDSDVWVDELPITLTVTGATDVDNITSSVTLTIDGEDYSETVSTSVVTSATVTFDNLDLTLGAGDTYNFTVSADIVEFPNTTEVTEGDTLTASLSTTNRNQIVAENEEGDALAVGEKTGSATGKAQEFRTQGVSLALVSTDESVSDGTSNDDDSATFTIKFKVTAVGEDAYVATTVAAGTDYTVDKAGTATTGGVSGVIVNNTDTDLTAGYNWLVEAGSSETLTLTVSKSPYSSDSDGLWRAVLSALRWNSDDSNDTYNSYTSNLDDFATDYVTLN